MQKPLFPLNRQHPHGNTHTCSRCRYNITRRLVHKCCADAELLIARSQFANASPVETSSHRKATPSTWTEQEILKATRLAGKLACVYTWPRQDHISGSKQHHATLIALRIIDKRNHRVLARHVAPGCGLKNSSMKRLSIKETFRNYDSCHWILAPVLCTRFEYM